MKVFHVLLVVAVCAFVSMGTIFSGGMFQALSQEGNQTAGGAKEAVTMQSYLMAHAWVYIIALLLLIAVIIVALKLFREVPDEFA